jgi:hypothetical protein
MDEEEDAEEEEEEGEITETRSSAQAAANYAAQMNPMTDASFAAASSAATTPQRGAAAAGLTALARTGDREGQAALLTSWGVASDTDEESGEGVNVAVPARVTAAAGIAPMSLAGGAHDSEGEHADETGAPTPPDSTSQEDGVAAVVPHSAADQLALGVGSTILTRSARDEFEIHTVDGLAKQGDKVGNSALCPGQRPNYSAVCHEAQHGPLSLLFRLLLLSNRLQVHLTSPGGERRHGLAAPFDQLFLPQSLDLSALKSNERVWALFDLSLSGLGEELGDRPEWTTVYHPAQVCADQMGVPPQSVRVEYCDAAYKGKRAIVTAEVQTLGKSFPGLVQVSRSEMSAGVRASWRYSLRDGAVLCLPPSAADR